VRCLAARRYFDDEDPEVETITLGWELTDESHDYCGYCGWRGHGQLLCPNRPGGDALHDRRRNPAAATCRRAPR
jgi:hypothetical protein